MCCENQEDFTSWQREIANIMKRREEGSFSDTLRNSNGRSSLGSRDNMSFGIPEINMNTIQRTVMDEKDYKTKTPTAGHNNSGKSLFKTNSKSKLSFLTKRRSHLHNLSFNDDMLQLQRARLGEEKVYNSYTGNVGIASTATFSRYESLEKLEFFQVFISSCDDHLDIATRQQLVTKFLRECQFEFYMEEGQILISEGSKFEWVYFVLQGEIEQRKNWTSSPHHIDEKILPGRYAGFVEVLHFNGVSTTTLLVGPGTVCLKMSVATFKKQFQHNQKEKALFSTAMNPSSTLYLERLTTFTFKRLSNLPLLERQPIGNVQALVHIFTPVCIASGDHLMNEGSASDDFYIIVEGSCSVFQKSSLDSDEVDEIVRSCRGGDWLGEAGLINIQSRLITVVAYSDVVALRTNAAGFKRFLDIVGPSVREAITQSTTTYLRTMLKTIPLFANLDETQIVEICREVEIKELDRDTLLYDTGDKIEDLYVILHGHVKCAISSVSGLDLSESPPFIDTMREYDFFGESAVLYESTPSRMQYFTPKDVKVVVLSISAKKLKPILPLCPILQLRFEERLLVRKTHLDLIDTLVDSISASLSARHEPRGSDGSRPRSKQSLGHMSDMKAKQSISTQDEVLYLREEVNRLKGVPYSDTLKQRSQSGAGALSTFKSTMRRIKSSMPNSTPKVPERKRKQTAGSKEAEFAAAGNRSPGSQFPHKMKNSTSPTLSNITSFSSEYTGDVQSVQIE
jgi:CRP-like cAMP-binding protein